MFGTGSIIRTICPDYFIDPFDKLTIQFIPGNERPLELDSGKPTLLFSTEGEDIAFATLVGIRRQWVSPGTE